MEFGERHKRRFSRMCEGRMVDFGTDETQACQMFDTAGRSEISISGEDIMLLVRGPPVKEGTHGIPESLIQGMHGSELQEAEDEAVRDFIGDIEGCDKLSFHLGHGFTPVEYPDLYQDDVGDDYENRVRIPHAHCRISGGSPSEGLDVMADIKEGFESYR